MPYSCRLPAAASAFSATSLRHLGLGGSTPEVYDIAAKVYLLEPLRHALRVSVQVRQSLQAIYTYTLLLLP
jgi:hypothetical protein